MKILLTIIPFLMIFPALAQKKLQPLPTFHRCGEFQQKANTLYNLYMDEDKQMKLASAVSKKSISIYMADEKKFLEIYNRYLFAKMSYHKAQNDSYGKRMIPSKSIINFYGNTTGKLIAAQNKLRSSYTRDNTARERYYKQLAKAMEALNRSNKATDDLMSCIKEYNKESS